MFLKNLNALNIQNPTLVKRLKEFSIEDAKKVVSVLQAESGDLIIAYNNQPLDDLINPLEKSKNVWDGLIKSQLKKNDIVLVFGLGLGYLFKRAYVNSSSRIIVYEPKIEVLRFVLEYVDFSQQFLDNRICITDQESDVLDYLSAKYISNDKIEIVYSEIYLNFFSDTLLSLSKKIIQICEFKNADVSTIKKLSKHWSENSVYNVKCMANSRPLGILKNVFSGKTALILGAGPSLKNDIGLIKQNRNKFVVFAVNKVFDYIVDNGIEPDFLVAADALWLKYTMRVMPEVFGRINLIATTKADNFIYSQNFHSVFNYYLKNDSFYEELSKKFPEEISLYDTEGTAVSQCYYSALEMRFSKIIFCGLDLAIKQDEAYAPDIKMIAKDDGSAIFSKESRKIIDIKSVSGGLVKTRDDYALFVKQLESAFARNSDAKLYNTSDFGAYIEGMIYKPLSDIIRGLEPVSLEVNSEIAALYANSKDKWQEIYEAQLEILKTQQKDILKIKSDIETWIEKHRTIIESIDKDNLTPKKAEKLQKVRAEEIVIIKHILSNNILGPYFQSEIFEYSQLNSEDADFIDSRRYSLKLFEQIIRPASVLAAI